MAKQNKGKIIKFNIPIEEFCKIKLTKKEFKYITWDELLKEEKNGKSK